jgi:hypothetical protein
MSKKEVQYMILWVSKNTIKSQWFHFSFRYESGELSIIISRYHFNRSL